MTSAPPVLPTLYLDADACPVKEETFRVAHRYGLKVIVVSNSPLFLPKAEWIESVVVGSGFDAVDDWIDGQVKKNDIVVTGDLLLAARCLKREGRVINPRGRLLDEDNIGEALAHRELMSELRQRGALDTGPKKMGKTHVSNYLSGLDELINAVLRAKR